MEDSYYSRMFVENNMGFSVNIEDYDLLADVVIFAKNNPEKLREMAKRAHEFALNNYSSDKSIRKLLDIFEMTIKNKR
jgi:glycosyltransferase involved in cell wall biosynthesis